MTFTSALRGYNKQDVDLLIASLEADHKKEVDRKEKVLEQLEAQIKNLEEEKSRLLKEVDKESQLEEEVKEMLTVIRHSVDKKEKEALEDKRKAISRVEKKLATLEEGKDYMVRLQEELVKIKQKNHYIDQLVEGEDLF